MRARTIGIGVVAAACVATVAGSTAAATAGSGATVAGAPLEDRALYREECGACHLDYPPGLLPARSWQRVMAGLEHHFRTDASLEPEIRDRLARWLTENAAEADTHRKSRKILRSLGGETPLRISEVPYVRREHDEIRPADLARVKTIAHCAACHPGAERWDFEEHLD
jgi:hypothetical protein